MKTKKTTKVSKSGKITLPDKHEKAFKHALENLDKAVKDRILNAKDPFNVGIKMAEQLKQMAMRIEDDVQDESMNMTEAGYVSKVVVGVGIGVI